MRSDPEQPDYPVFYIHSLNGAPTDFDDWPGRAFGEDFFAEPYIDVSQATEKGAE